MASFNHAHFQCSFQNWMEQQQQDLDELLRSTSSSSSPTTNDLKQQCEKAIRHFEEYCGRRAAMAKDDAACFMSPPWCSSLERAFMWAGGCRPSLCIRLLYCVCGAEVDEQLDALLRGERRGNLAELSARQLELINTLHCRTVKEEDKFTSRIATLQEEIADEPLVKISQSAERVGEWNRELEQSMTAHSNSLAEILAEADRLRLETLKEMMAILTPLQGVELLIATKKLHISMHCWGNTRKCPLQQASTSASVA